MITTILIISCFSAVYAGSFSPWEDFKNYLGIGKELKWCSKRKVVNYIIKFLHHILNCECISFYLGWFFLGFGYGFIAYVAAKIIHQQINQTTIW